MKKNGSCYRSPSLGREWIEIAMQTTIPDLFLSPSLGREWIEITPLDAPYMDISMSPSLGREWIEIQFLELEKQLKHVSLLGEGVD